MNEREELGRLLFMQRVADNAGSTAPEILDRCDEAAT